MWLLDLFGSGSGNLKSQNLKSVPPCACFHGFFSRVLGFPVTMLDTLPSPHIMRFPETGFPIMQFFPLMGVGDFTLVELIRTVLRIQILHNNFFSRNQNAHKVANMCK